MPWDVLSDEQRELRDLVRTLARERIAPRAAEIDATHEFPWDVVELFRDGGIFGLFFDEEVGGTGTGTLLSLTNLFDRVYRLPPNCSPLRVTCQAV